MARIYDIQGSGVIYSHYNLAPWDKERWPNFTAKELSCPCCGEYYHHGPTLDAIQFVRNDIGKPVFINSGHRCWRHNAEVGGAPLSQHKKIALDLSTKNHDKHELKKACVKAGFKGFGHYMTFLHVDMGRKRWWVSSKGAAKLWKL